MKKYIFLSLFAFTAILIIFSCRKNPDFLDDSKTRSYIESTAEMKVMNFLSSPNNTLKDEKVYSTDSAIWYSEAALNFTYAIFDSSFVYRAIDTSVFSFDLDENNYVTQSELEDVYGDMVDSLDAYYDGLQDNIKHLMFCDVVEVDVTGGQLDVLMIAHFGCGYTGFEWSYFGETDDWYSILELGKCPPYQEEGDASIALTEAFMTQMTVSQADKRIWFSDEVTVYEIDPRNYAYVQAPRGYRGFYYYGSGIMSNPQCCDDDELNFYMTSNGIPYIIHDNIPENPEGLEKESVIVIGDYSPGDDYWQEIHFLEITYGIRHETTVPASPM